MDTDNAVPHADRGDSLIVRLIYSLGFAAVAYLGLLLLFALAIAQFVVAAIDHKPNAELRSFIRRLVRYLAEVTAFTALASEVRPFPFGPFPTDLEA